MSTPPRRIGKYELREHLGRGGMAEVWKALDTQLGRFVAIKILHPDLQSDPSFVIRFEREARVIASLHHPNIIQIYDFHIAQPPEVETTLAYMVMDYVDGPTLAHYLHHTAHIGMFLSPTQLLQLFTPICLAVDYAHEQGMIHRDLKPSNILLDKRGVAKTAIGVPILSDFGIVKMLSSTTNSLSGGWLGTPTYISPEQVAGAAGNERSDIYSLSVILYEACTGTLPFQGETPTAIMMQHLHATPTPPGLINKTIPPALSAVIMRGLAKSPDDRFTTASALVASVADALGLPSSGSASVLPIYSGPTYITPSQALPPSHMRPSVTPHTPPHGASTHEMGAKPTSLPVSNSDGALLVASPSGSVTPLPLLGGTSSASYQTDILNTGSRPPTVATVPQTPSVLYTRSNKPTRWRVLVTLLIILLLLAGSILSLLVLIPKSSPPNVPAVAQNPIVGYASFISSGLLNPSNSTGVNDELQINLQHIPAPAVDKAYYGWLLGDRVQSEPVVTPLGQLPFKAGTISFLFQGDQKHSNLLLLESRFLITEEDVTNPPVSYSLDTSTWRYYAQIPQAPNPKDKLHFTMLDHLRHLTSDSPELTVRGLRGGLDMWFVRQVQKVLEWSNAARDDWQKDPDFLHRQIIRILDYIDGANFVQKDAPAVGPTLLADVQPSQVPLLGPVPDGQDPPGYSFDDEPAPGYVYLVSSHLSGAVLAPDATATQHALANQIQESINQVKAWLENIHQDAKKLLAMDANQLNQPSTLTILDDMVTNAQYAYVGQVDPLTAQNRGGVIWISNHVQQMAAFGVTAYHS